MLLKRAIPLRLKQGLGRFRGLGTVSTQVGNSLVFGSNPVARTVAPERYYIATQRIPSSGWGADPPRYLPRYPVIELPPVVGRSWSTWGSNPPAWTAAGSAYGTSPNSQYSAQQLAAAQALYQTNPGLLSQAQYQMLVAAGVIASTVPYSSLSQVPGTTIGSGAGAIDPATGVPYANEVQAAQASAASAASSSGTDIGTMLSTDYAGLPLFAWLLIAGGGILLLSRPSGRR